MENFIKKAQEILVNVLSKLDDLSDKIFEQTQVRINFKMIIIGFLLVIFILMVVKSIFGWIGSQLL